MLLGCGGGVCYRSSQVDLLAHESALFLDLPFGLPTRNGGLYLQSKPNLSHLKQMTELCGLMHRDLVL